MDQLLVSKNVHHSQKIKGIEIQVKNLETLNNFKNPENEIKVKRCIEKNQNQKLVLKLPQTETKTEIENSVKTNVKVKASANSKNSARRNAEKMLPQTKTKPVQKEKRKQDFPVPFSSWNLMLALNLLFSLLTILVSFVILPKLLNVIVVSAVPVPNENGAGAGTGTENTSVNSLLNSIFPVHQHPRQLELEIDDGKNRHGDGELNSESESESVGVGCVCDGDCERIGPSECPWGLTLDVCGCCFICSRGEGEPCGGATGNCKKGLHCQQQGKGVKAGQGVCSKDGDEKICEDPVERYGCLFDGDSCVCENHWICPQVDLFLFNSENSCRSRIAILNSHPHPHSNTNPNPDPAEPFHSQPEFQFQFQAPTSSSSSSSSSSNVATESCDGVSCSEIEDCPLDSYRLPTPKNLQSSEIILDKSKDCCPFAQPCMCNHNVICTPPKCPRNWLPTLVLNATGQPGNCCPLWACIADP